MTLVGLRPFCKKKNLESDHFSRCQGSLLNPASYSGVDKSQVFGENWRSNVALPPDFL